MVRSKRRGRTPRGNGPPRGTPRRPNSASKNFYDTIPQFPGATQTSNRPPQFSLQDEARNTERHHSFWSSDQKLRHRQVDFISAGTLHGDDSKSTGGEQQVDATSHSNVDALAQMSIQSDSDSSTSSNAHPNTKTKVVNQMQPEIPTSPIVKPPAPTFFVDTDSLYPSQIGLPALIMRSSSPTPSDSSEEVIVFKGRRGFRNTSRTHSPLPQPRGVSNNPNKSDGMQSEGIGRNFSHGSGFTLPPCPPNPTQPSHNENPPITNRERIDSPLILGLRLPMVRSSTLPHTSDIDNSRVQELSGSLRSRYGMPVKGQFSKDEVRDGSIAKSVPTLTTDEQRSQTQPQTDTTVEGGSRHSQSEGSEDILPSFLAKRLAGKSAWEIGGTEWVHRSKPGIGWLPAEDRPLDTRSGKRPRKPQLQDVADDEALRDYIQNLKDQLEIGGPESMHDQATFSQRNLSLDDGNDWVPGSDSSAKVNPPDAVLNDQMERTALDQDGWNSDMLNDFDNLSTSSDVIGTIGQVLGRREGKRGPQYLVVYKGSPIDDARWLPATLLMTPSDVELIRVFEEKQLEKNLQGTDTSESDDRNGTDEDDDEEDFQDEKDLIARRLERMTDEKIARRLAKQEELGLGSDDVMLFDEEDGVEEVEGTLVANRTIFALNSGSSRHSRPRGKRTKVEFPSASLMADVLDQDPYNGFDVMDFDRPSLKKSKDRQGIPPIELSDSEFDSHLRTVWEADRKNKRQKKVEREELRAKGLLGKKNQFKADLHVKYKSGFSWVQIKEEIREFTISPHTSRALPPMDATERAFVHRFAKQLGLTSKSVGTGKGRFTNLSKTNRTRPYNEDFFNNLTRWKFSNWPGSSRNAQHGIEKRSLVSYRDGEVVGASAPEIGAGNRGRAMLEKMGWTSGTALGALDNKGILQPIAHTVKTGKAGLK